MQYSVADAVTSNHLFLIYNSNSKTWIVFINGVKPGIQQSLHRLSSSSLLAALCDSFTIDAIFSAHSLTTDNSPGKIEVLPLHKQYRLHT